VEEIIMVNTNMIMGSLIISVLALVFAVFKARFIIRQEEGTDRMKKIALAISDGAMAFLKREYTVLFVFVIVVASLIAIFIQIESAFAFIAGAFLSAVAGFVGMKISVKANVRTANAARTSLTKALTVAFSSGSVMGFTVAGLGLLGITSMVYILGISVNSVEIISGFAMGASSIALFGRVGGGIYTKGADVGADLVGKVEQGIPEDDPRNPAVIADNVGDNVGDIAGMGADLYESYVGSMVATMTLAFFSRDLFDTELAVMNAALLPLLIAGAGLVSSFIATFFVKTSDPKKVHTTLSNGLLISSVISIISFYFILGKMFEPDVAMRLFWAVISGLIAGFAIGKITEYYTDSHYAPTQQVAKSCETGSATNIISGFANGMYSSALPVIIVCLVIFIAYYFAGVYGIAVSAVGMLATTAMTVSVDAYGPVADNAGGIAEMSGLPKEVRVITDKLDSVGNTTAAVGKGFAISSAAVTALALFTSYTQKVEISVLNITEPEVLIGLFIGAMLPYVFCAMTMKSVGKTAEAMIIEVRRQFREIVGIMEEKAEPEYGKCVDIATKAALKEMIIPGIAAVIIPIIVGLWDAAALGGLLAGTMISSFLLAIFMANSGGSWDNAKKYIEEGHYGGKGSEAHKASVVGDTVGDPFKDTSGPSLNILMKLMSIVALVFAKLFI
jgi:K(+)-stimulated pyrophosphate-energized sodium pump